ncbi:MAG: YkgJ family cysteine cluster protein [Phycisphaeraceae bacterium]|nr:YkgJ family cysteine cluster protein [Phycisphaeraceae bacterium]
MELTVVVATQCICARCASHQKTCCQTSEIYATKGDVRRIEQHTGRTGFTRLQKPENPSYADQDDDPIWATHVLRPDGTRRVLLRRDNGDCLFLGNAGCVLPLDTRPLVCRMYPFTYNDQGIDGVDPDRCPTGLLQEGENLLDAMGMNIDDARRWHSQLYREIRDEAMLEGQGDAHRPDVRP